MSEVVHFTEFRFNSLRKFMAPLYAALQRQISEPIERKQQILLATLPEFYKRMRSYRDLSLEEIAVGSNVALSELQSFERGELRATKEIEWAYCKICHGHHERTFFAHEIYAFFHPSVRESSLAIAKDVFTKFGLISPYVDYQNLNTPRGKVLEFKR